MSEAAKTVLAYIILWPAIQLNEARKWLKNEPVCASRGVPHSRRRTFMQWFLNTFFTPIDELKAKLQRDYENQE